MAYDGIDRKKVVHLGYTYGELENAFEAVKPKGHWKDRIDVILPLDIDTKPIHAAIGFYCGGHSQEERLETGVRITAPGYWEVIGT